MVLLAHAALRTACARLQRQVPGLTPAAISCLLLQDCRRSLFELIRKHDIDVDRYRRPGDELPPRAEEPLGGYDASPA